MVDAAALLPHVWYPRAMTGSDLSKSDRHKGAERYLVLQPGEHMVFACQPSWVALFSTKQFGVRFAVPQRRRTWYVLTDRRIITTLVKIGRHERAIPLEWVQDLNYVHGPFASTVMVSSAGGQLGATVIGPMAHQDGEKFRVELTKLLAGRK